ncbi:MAG: hypothetical protein AB7S26_30755 [Sandaracinaceae bacterium]
MLTLVTGVRQVRAATKKFRAQLAAVGNPVRHMVGHLGHSAETRVWVLRRHGFFWCPDDHEKLSWNAFGLVMPEEARVLPIVVEVNVPWEGVDRRVGGVFLEGSRGEIYLGHRGKIGGGRKGVGKTAFWERYHQQRQEVLGDGPVVVLGRVGSAKLPTDIATFIRTVDEIKKIATGSTKGRNLARSTDEDPIDFRPEFEGAKRVAVSRRIEAQCRHGTIVRQLRAALTQCGWTAGNDRARDLVARPSPKAPAVTFEVKTDTSSQSIFTGVGQLVVHARPKATGKRGILVVPDDLTSGAEALLGAEGIGVLRYRWVDDEHVEFDGLDRITRKHPKRRRGN